MSTAEFDTAVTEMTMKLRAFIRRRVRDDATADDLAQETLLKVYRSRAALRDDQRIEAWLYRIARTTLIDFYRRERPGTELPEDIAGEPQERNAEVTAAMTRSLRHFLDELPVAYREPLRLAEFEGLPLTKVALRLGISLTATKSRVRRGREQLKKKLQQCCRLEFDRHGRIIDYTRRKSAHCCPTCEPAAALPRR